MKEGAIPLHLSFGLFHSLGDKPFRMPVHSCLVLDGYSGTDLLDIYPIVSGDLRYCGSLVLSRSYVHPASEYRPFSSFVEHVWFG